MADSARAEAECKEFFDDAESLNIKIKKLAELVLKSQHFVAFTGAGISTAAGIADFRSGINTVLETGAGKWARQDADKQGKEYKTAKKKTKVLKAIPTPSHMALVALMKHETKYLKYLVSQNCDGLHRRSGIPVDQLSELHGNGKLEICVKCKRGYLRDYRVKNSLRKQGFHDHFTGRYCTVPGCKGKLHHTTVAFKENLPEEPLELAENHSMSADLYLSLGSSLTVSPACNMPEVVGKKWKKERKKFKDKEPVHNLVIVNLQQTDLDDICSLRIFAKIDDVMIGLMKELGIEIPKWYLTRFVKIKIEDDLDDAESQKLIVSAVDVDGINASMFTDVKLMNNGNKISQKKEEYVVASKRRFKPDEYVFSFPNTLEIVCHDADADKADDADADKAEDDGDKGDEEENKDDVDKAEDDGDNKDNDNDNDGDDEKKQDIESNKGLVVELAFYGHYKEPNLLIQLNEYLNVLKGNDGYIVLKMMMDPFTKVWNVGNLDEQLKDENVKKSWSIYKEKQQHDNETKDNHENDEDD